MTNESFFKEVRAKSPGYICIVVIESGVLFHRQLFSCTYLAKRLQHSRARNAVRKVALRSRLNAT